MRILHVLKKSVKLLLMKHVLLYIMKSHFTLFHANTKLLKISVYINTSADNTNIDICVLVFLEINYFKCYANIFLQSDKFYEFCIVLLHMIFHNSGTYSLILKYMPTSKTVNNFKKSERNWIKNSSHWIFISLVRGKFSKLLKICLTFI